MPYENLNPTLAALLPVKDYPQDNEAANLLDDAIRQTRNWVYSYLGSKFDINTEFLKSSVLNVDSFPSSVIKGSTANADGAAGSIYQGTVSTPDLRDLAVSSAKVADSAITAVKLATDAVTTVKVLNAAITADKLATDSVITAKVQALAITAAKLADEAVENVKIKAGTIENDRIKTNDILGNKLVVGTVGQMLVGGNTVGGVGNCFAPKTISGAFEVNADGVVTLTATAALASGLHFWRISEKAGTTISAGDAVRNAWNLRGSQTPWNIEDETIANVMEVDSGTKRIKIKGVGVFLIYVSCPGYGVGGHKLRLSVKKDGVDATVTNYYGTAENAPHNGGSGAQIQSRSFLTVLVTIAHASETNFGYLELNHYCGTGDGSTTPTPDGLGLAIGDGSDERFATIEIMKVG